MKRFYLLIVIAAVALSASLDGVGRVVGGKPSPAATRDLSAPEVRRAMDRVFRAQVQASLAWTDSLAPLCEGEPMYHLMRARLYRELIPVDDEQKEDLKRVAAPLHNELEQVLAICDARIEAGDTDPNLRLYRGWARMLMSHVRTYEKSFWSAGRDAKKGKEDLEWYLAQKPNDPVASSLMGAFLYFADTLPAAYKFVSKLLFLPSGDRERGLQMMELARGWNSIMETDNALILYSVYMGFEGRYEEGLEGFEALRREFPEHATFVRPFAIIYPLLPRQGAEYGDSLDAATARIAALSDAERDNATYTLIRFERAFADRYYHPSRSIERFEAIMNENPPHPDWVSGYSAFELGRLMAARGNAAKARALWKQALNDARIGYLHEEVKSMLSELDKIPGGSGAGPADVDAIYRDDTEARARVRTALESKKDPSVADMFYLGEARLMSGDAAKALDAYTGAINPKAARWDEGYQMLASARAGEILGSQGEYKAASKHYERAGKFLHKEFLFDWILAARQRYFDRLDQGKETTPPSLLLTTGK
jgi:tetratricopeptide (TPR) repeat protein